MSAVTNQPLPFGRLKREKHIEMIFRAFQNRCEPSCECQTNSPGPKPEQTSPVWGSDDQLSGLIPERKMENSFMQPPEKDQASRPVMEEQNLGGGAGTDFMSVLETVGRIYISARPDLQGKEMLCICVFLCVEEYYYNTEISLFENVTSL